MPLPQGCIAPIVPSQVVVLFGGLCFVNDSAIGSLVGGESNEGSFYFIESMFNLSSRFLLSLSLVAWRDHLQRDGCSADLAH